MKSGILKLLELALVDFGRHPRSSDSLRGRRNFVFCQVNNARFRRFPVGQDNHVARCHDDNVWNRILKKITVMGRFSQKTQKFLTKFQRLATSVRHNYAMITDRPNNPSTVRDV